MGRYRWLAAVLGTAVLCGAGWQDRAPGDWGSYNGSATGDHFSPLGQITPANVSHLKMAWRYDAGMDGGLQTNPLVIGGVLYGYTSTLGVFALDAATGKERWRFDSGIVGRQPSRGMTWWSGSGESRLFATIMNFLYALDPATGKPIASFGEGGRLDLRKDLDSDYTKNTVALTTPGVLYGDLLIVGFRAPETKPAPRGDIRAYNVRTGRLAWSFHTIPHPGEEGYRTWPESAWKDAGAANNWAGMAVDAARGIVFVPTGSAVPDFYGAERVGDGLFANCLIALDAKTGKMLWHFQAVHHDIWDRDFPSPPVLLTVQRDGKAVDAVAQATKHGYLFVFDRVTGRPLFPVEEHAFPASEVPGEVASKMQPVPLAPKPYARQRLTAEMLTARTPEAHRWAVEQFGTMRSGGQFLPFAVDKQTVIFPGYDGGAEWGGQAADAARGVIYLNANDVAWTGGLTGSKGGRPGTELYAAQCAGCHGANREGSPPAFPSLLGVNGRLTQAQIVETIHNGKGRMPGFPAIEGTRLDLLLGFLQSEPDKGNAKAGVAAKELVAAEAPRERYRFTGYKKFLDPDGYPAVVPPWGTLQAIDLNTGKYLWKVPLGEYPELASKNTGSENYGGPVLTASGVLFIGATIYDNKLRAFEAKTGRLLWEGKLPFAGTATPATYMVEGKQYIVIAASGARNPKGPQGAAYVAFALP